MLSELFFDLILPAWIFFAFRNGAKAKSKDQSPVLWGFITLVAYFVALIIGAMIVVYNFCKVDTVAFSSPDVKIREAAAQQFAQSVSANPLHGLTILLSGIGGYLLVRYILEQKPDKKEPEIHWMDRMGGGEQ